MDNCFTLQAMVQKYISRPKGRLYCIFIDFSKAFDSVFLEIYPGHNLFLSGKSYFQVGEMWWGIFAGVYFRGVTWWCNDLSTGLHTIQAHDVY
jgi:hypothetical protein